MPLVSFHYRRQESKAYDLRPSAQNKRIISFPTHYNWFSSPLSYRHPPLCLMETPSCLKTTFHGHPAVAFSLSFFLLVVRACLSVLEVFLYFSPFIFSAGICFKAFSWFCLLKDLRGREKILPLKGSQGEEELQRVRAAQFDCCAVTPCPEFVNINSN